jgi:hypothetical protein
MADSTGSRVDFAGIQALSSREAGYSVAKKCLEVQAEAERLDPSLRTERGVRLHDDARSWYTGALGERHVGELLRKLGPEWFVRHAVPIGSDTKDVDHLVIGPGGVFSINTKHHANASVWVGDYALRVNNFDDHYTQQSNRDASDVATRLTAKVGFAVEVTPTLAFYNPGSISDKGATGKRKVAVVNATRLVAWLKSRPRVFSDTELALITIAAEEPETWHVDPRAADTLRVMQRFERLVASVGTPPAPSAVSSRRAPSSRGTSGTRRPKTSSGQRRGSSASAGDLVKLWLAIGLVIGVALAFREFANQPCQTPVACIVPMFYLMLKPILVLGSVAMIGIGAIGTLVWAVRRARR